MQNGQSPEQRAQDLIAFCDGIEEGGFPGLARRVRLTARDVLELAPALEAEKRARGLMEADRDRWRDNRWRELHGQGWPG